MKFSSSVIRMSFLLSSLLLLPVIGESAPVIMLDVDLVSFGQTTRTTSINLSGSNFVFSATLVGGYDFPLVQYGQSLGIQAISVENTIESINYSYYRGNITYDGAAYFAEFTGDARSAALTSAIAPRGTGSIVVPAFLQGSFDACLVTASQNQNAPCDSTLPTFTLSFAAPGYIRSDFRDQVGQLTQYQIIANAPVPEPSTIAMLFGGLLLVGSARTRLRRG